MAKQTAAKIAFKCKNCGAVAPAGHAGENDVPAACVSCRAGVKFEANPDGVGFTITHQPENWIKLWELSDAELKKAGLTRNQIEEHKGKGAAPEGKAHSRSVTEKVGSKDRG